MNAKIEFEYQDEKYCLEYNREAIKLMEKSGFQLQKFLDEPVTMGDIAFQGAFIKNHRGIKPALIKEIYDSMNDKPGLSNALVEMISDTYTDLYADNTDKDGKNTEWKIV